MYQILILRFRLVFWHCTQIFIVSIYEKNQFHWHEKLLNHLMCTETFNTDFKGTRSYYIQNFRYVRRTFYAVFICCFLGIHWYEFRQVIHRYGWSPVYFCYIFIYMYTLDSAGIRSQLTISNSKSVHIALMVNRIHKCP